MAYATDVPELEKLPLPGSQLLVSASRPTVIDPLSTGSPCSEMSLVAPVASPSVPASSSSPPPQPAATRPTAMKAHRSRMNARGRLVGTDPTGVPSISHRPGVSGPPLFSALLKSWTQNLMHVCEIVQGLVYWWGS